MRTLGMLLTLMIVACAPKAPSTSSTTTGSKPKGLPPPPVAVASQGPTCESAIANSMTLSLAAAADADRDKLRAQLDGAKPKMLAACHEDAWSPALLDCLDKARSDAATGTCTEFLTPAQQEAVGKRLAGP